MVGKAVPTEVTSRALRKTVTMMAMNVNQKAVPFPLGLEDSKGGDCSEGIAKVVEDMSEE